MGEPCCCGADEERVILDLTRAEADYLIECLSAYQDDGPNMGGGWQSDQLKAFVKKIRGEVGDD